MDNNSRTGPWQGHSDSVHIHEVGGPPESAGSAEGWAEAGRPLEEEPRFGGIHRPHSRTRPFRTAWILTGILLGIGLLWIGGVFDAGPVPGYATTVSVDPETGMPIQPDLPPLTVQLRNLASIAPAALLIGLLSAAALLITQGALRSRELQESAPAPVP